jgi:hypothetical protein
VRKDTLNTLNTLVIALACAVPIALSACRSVPVSWRPPGAPAALGQLPFLHIDMPLNPNRIYDEVLFSDADSVPFGYLIPRPMIYDVKMGCLGWLAPTVLTVFQSMWLGVPRACANATAAIEVDILDSDRNVVKTVTSRSHSAKVHLALWWGYGDAEDAGRMATLMALHDILGQLQPDMQELRSRLAATGSLPAARERLMSLGSTFRANETTIRQFIDVIRNTRWTVDFQRYQFNVAQGVVVNDARVNVVQPWTLSMTLGDHYRGPALLLVFSGGATVLDPSLSPFEFGDLERMSAFMSGREARLLDWAWLQSLPGVLTAIERLDPSNP